MPLQKPLEVRKDEFDWVRVGAVRRQVNEPRPRCGRNRFANACELVSTEYDPLCPLHLLQSELAYTDVAQIPAAAFSIITALEVFEHQLDPLPTIQRLANYVVPHGALAISTNLYESEKHDRLWPYLLCQAGQHVTFYTRRSLRVLADACGMPTVCLFPSAEGFLILFTCCERHKVATSLRQAERYLCNPRLQNHWTIGAWDILRWLDAPRARQLFILP